MTTTPDEEPAAEVPRRVVSLSTGTRICSLIGALLLLVAAYLYWTPLEHPVSGSFPARCGTAARPPSDNLGRAVCGSVNEQRRNQALTALGAAVVMLVGGSAAFGVTRVVPRGDS